MSFELDSQEGPRATHQTEDGGVYVGGRLDVFGSEMAAEQVAPAEHPMAPEQGTFNPDVEYLDEVIGDAVGGVMQDAGLDPYYDQPSAADIADQAIIGEETEADLRDLIAERPEIVTEAARARMAPAMRQIAEQYGMAFALDPSVIEDVFDGLADDQLQDQIYQEEIKNELFDGFEPGGMDPFT